MADVTVTSFLGVEAESFVGTVSAASNVPVSGLISFTTSSGSTEVTVEHVNHGAVTGSFVILSNVTFGSGSTYNSLITLLTGEFEITVISGNSYSITLSSNAGFDLVSSGTSDADYLLNKGGTTQLLGTGWGRLCTILF